MSDYHNESLKNNNDDLNLKAISNFLSRNISYVLGLSFIFLGIILINEYRERKGLGIIYQGEFKLHNPKLMGTKPIFNLLDNEINQKTNFISKEEIILKSEYFLKPIYENYKSNIRMNSKKFKNIDYKDWRSKLELEFINDSEIISIKYQDANKKIISIILGNLQKELNKYTNKNISNKLIEIEDYLILKKGFISYGDGKKILKDINKENLKNTFKWEIISGPNYEIFNGNLRLEIFIRIYFFANILLFLILYLKEMNSGIIYDINVIKNKICCKSLMDIYLNNEKIDLTIFKRVFFNDFPENKDLKFGLVFADSIFTANKSRIYNMIFPFNANVYGIDISDEKLISNMDYIYICAKPGICTFENINILNNYLNIYRNKVKGLISILPKDYS